MAAFNSPPPRNSFCYWMTNIRLSRLIVLLLFILITVPLIAHYYISNMGSESYGDTHRSRSKLEHNEDLASLKASDLKFRIEELKRIKASVNNELRDLESKRQKLHAEINGYNTHIEKLKNEYEKTLKDLQQMKITIENTKLEQEELVQKNMPDIRAPKRILATMGDGVHLPPPRNSRNCHMHTCFDYSRCSLTSGFPVYFYNANEYGISPENLEPFLRTSVTQTLTSNPHLTFDPHIACVFVVLLGDLQDAAYNATYVEHKLRHLPHWKGDGRNHILLNLARTFQSRNLFDSVDTGRAVIVQSTFTELEYRSGFDLLIPPAIGVAKGDVWEGLPPQVPAKRKYLLSFLGENKLLENYVSRASESQKAERFISKNAGDKKPLGKILSNSIKDNMINQNLPRRTLQSIESSNRKNDDNVKNNEYADLMQLEYSIMHILKKVQGDYPQDGFHVDFSCGASHIEGAYGEWSLCGSEFKRHDLLAQSTFSLIIAPTNYSMISTVLTQIRVFEALKYGAIPIILGEYVKLPFHEFIDWHKAVLWLPKTRVTEFHFLIRTYGDSDILSMRHHCRIYWEKYFATSKSIIDMILATIRTRLKIPPLPVNDEVSPSVFNGSFVPLKDDGTDPQPEAEDILGPIEPPLPSVTFRRNFTIGQEVFNHAGDPFRLYPYTPFEPTLPSEAKFLGKSHFYLTFFSLI